MYLIDSNCSKNENVFISIFKGNCMYVYVSFHTRLVARSQRDLLSKMSGVWEWEFFMQSGNHQIISDLSLPLLLLG
jgi:hypothetical protein